MVTTLKARLAELRRELPSSVSIGIAHAPTHGANVGELLASPRPHRTIPAVLSGRGAS